MPNPFSKSHIASRKAGPPPFLAGYAGSLLPKIVRVLIGQVNLFYLLHALTIQPLVENALIHSCEAKSGEVLIRICLASQDDSLAVSVQDNGIGMEAEAPSALQMKLAQCNDAGLEETGSESSCPFPGEESGVCPSKACSRSVKHAVVLRISLHFA